MQNRIYYEAIESRQLLEQNRHRLLEYYSRGSALSRRINTVKQLLLNGDMSSIIRLIDLRINRSKYVHTDGNDKFSNLIKENTQNIPEDSKIAVYTCLVGDYANIQEPQYLNPDMDYIIFTDQDLSKDSKWKKIDLKKYGEYEKLTPVAMNRRVKMLSHEYLSDYDYTVYIDSTVRVAADLYPMVCNMGDALIGVHIHASRDCIYMEGEAVIYSGKTGVKNVAEQLSRYRKEGFPEHYGLFQNSIIIKNQTKDKCKWLMMSWWNEYRKDNTRDQISLPYILWKNDIKKEEIKVLGVDASNNPRFIIDSVHRKTRI